MNKQELLQQIQNAVQDKSLTKNEILDAYRSGAKGGRHLHMSDILSYIGGGIVILGICILVAQNWDLLNDLTKILITLGSGIAAYTSGLLFFHEGRSKRLAYVFFLMSALLLPLGLHVAFDIAGMDIGSRETQSTISGILTATFLSSYMLYKNNTFLFFGIIFATWLFFAFTGLLLENSAFHIREIWEYQTLAAGISYVLLGYHFADHPERKALTGFLYGFGILGILGACFSFIDDSAFWEILYPGLTFGTIFLSTKLKSKSFLTFGVLFLMGYLLYITDEYFASSFGWPLALVLVGFAMMAVGYFGVRIHKKYIASEN